MNLPKNKGLSQDKKDAIIKMVVMDGMTSKAASKIVGCSASTARQVVQEYNDVRHS